MELVGGDVGSIVLHAGCALTWAAHLTADGIDARQVSRTEPQVGR